ncbi:hypothetical protein ACFW9W_43995, partial [Streptomyces sp. NPDC059468]
MFAWYLMVTDWMRRTMLIAYLADAQARYISVNDVRLAVEVAGEGPAVLPLHGFPHTRAIWSEVAPLLTAAG